jgi:hypothetical protein
VISNKTAAGIRIARNLQRMARLEIAVFSSSSRAKLASIAAILVFLLLPVLAGARKPQLVDVGITRGKTASGFYYMVGGLAFDEQQTMERRSARYNLKLVFVRRLSNLISPVLLLIGDNRRQRIEQVMVHGPWFYIQLPPGGYTIVARIKDKVVVIRDVYLSKNRRVYFLRAE